LCCYPQLLLRKKAAEELKKEQERKAAERRRIIEERCGSPRNLSDASEGECSQSNQDNPINEEIRIKKKKKRELENQYKSIQLFSHKVIKKNL